MNSILFSPVGGTDPISFERDGGILHICRQYHPECVMLYLSSEMVVHQQKDDRYRKALKRLASEEDFPLEVCCEERPDLKNVHIFDIFYRDFERLLRELHQKYPKHQLLVNLSSGTPAMKSALAVLSNLMEFPITGIQVSSPNRRHNGRRDDPENFDLELYWECNLDREAETFENRCQMYRPENLRAQLQRQAIESHLSAWDYHAARSVGEQMGELLPKSAKELLDAACLRSQQNWRRIPLKLRDTIIPKADSDEKRDFFEYLLALHSKQQRGELAEFLRGLTPAVYWLAMFAIKEELGIDLRSYCDSDGEGKLLSKLLKKDEAGAEILQLLNKRYNGAYQDVYPSSEICCIILEQKAFGSGSTAKLLQLRDVERNARNLAAHTICAIDEKYMIENCKKTSGEIWELLRETAVSVLKNSNLIWNSYALMNQRILKCMAE